MKYDVIVIGTGAAGLMAAKDLTKSGYKICVLEAADAAGGRISTINENGFNEPVELGAEFIHGNLPLTLKLLKKANIPVVPVEGKMINVREENQSITERRDQHWGQFMKKIWKLEKDMTILQFLEKYFSDKKYEHLWNSVKGFAEGFDLADISKASVFFIRQEWSHENEIQYRIQGGYGKLIDFLLESCNKKNAEIHFNTAVNKIEYKRENVVAHTTNGKKFEAKKLIITASIGALQSGDIEFSPTLKKHATAIQEIGFGKVIKVLMQFKSNFWEKQYPDMGFLLTGKDIPTWWTQLPSKNALLTGWLGGPKVFAQIKATDEALLKLSLQSLSSAFKLSVDDLEKELLHYRIENWFHQPYIKGGYSYDMVGSLNAKKCLSKPVAGTIFFAGEALYEGGTIGTVESALLSGKATAKKVKAYLAE